MIFTQKFPKLTVLPISCKSGDGLEALRAYLFEHFVPKTDETEEENNSEAKDLTTATSDEKDPGACVL